MFKNVDIIIYLMSQDKNRTLDFISLLIAILSLIIPLVSFLLSAPNEIKVQSLIIFGIMVMAIIIFSFIYFIYRGYRNISYDLKDNRKEIDEIKRSLNYKELFSTMDVRLRVLEKLLEEKNRRGQIDPRIIWIIIMLILLYLFLKSIGIFP